MVIGVEDYETKPVCPDIQPMWILTNLEICLLQAETVKAEIIDVKGYSMVVVD